MWNSSIIRMTTGQINNVNDAVAGGIAGISGASKFAGQVGQPIWLDDSQIFYAGATAVFGGRFRYVKLASGATAVVRGQIVFWDISVADNLYQVTTSEAGSTPGAELRAGIVLNAGWSAGNYSFIQDCGPCYIKFRATLTGTPNVGVACFCAAAGTGADNGFADVLAGSGATTFSDVSLMQNRYLGSAIEAPTGGGLKLVNLNLMNLRG